MANQAAWSDIITKPALPGAKGHIICLLNVQHWPVLLWCECVLHMKTTNNFGERLLSENVPASENGRAVDGLEVSDAAALNAKLAQENARLTRERDLLRMVIENLPDQVYAKDKQGRFVLNNPTHAKALGANSPEEMKGKSDFDFFSPELAAQYYTDEQKTIETGQPVINQEQYKNNPRDPNSPKRWSVTSKVIWRDKDGDILGTVGITRDIHEFKMTQEALRQSEEKLRQFTAQLEHSNRELQDFAYVASHDLQEPLRKIVVFGDRLKEKSGEALAAESRDY